MILYVLEYLKQNINHLTLFLDRVAFTLPITLLPQNCGQDTRKVGLVLGKEGVTLMRDEQIIASLVEDW